MKLKARERVRERETHKTAVAVSSNALSETITTQFNTLLYNTLQNMVRNAHVAQDFTYTSVSDVIRAALQAYADGMSLSELVEPGSKKTLTLRLDAGLKAFYDSLPNRMKTRLLERAVRSYLKTL